MPGRGSGRFGRGRRVLTGLGCLGLLLFGGRSARPLGGGGRFVRRGVTATSQKYRTQQQSRPESEDAFHRKSLTCFEPCCLKVRVSRRRLGRPNRSTARPASPACPVSGECCGALHVPKAAGSVAAGRRRQLCKSRGRFALGTPRLAFARKAKRAATRRRPRGVRGSNPASLLVAGTYGPPTAGILQIQGRARGIYPRPPRHIVCTRPASADGVLATEEHGSKFSGAARGSRWRKEFLATDETRINSLSSSVKIRVHPWLLPLFLPRLACGHGPRCVYAGARRRDAGRGSGMSDTSLADPQVKTAPPVEVDVSRKTYRDILPRRSPAAGPN